MLHPGLLADEIHKPADYRAAQQFHWITAAIVFVPTLILTFYFCVFQTTVWPGVLGMTLAVLVSVFLPTFFTGMQSYLYHPRKIPVATQNRAIALSYYTCAPLLTIFLLGPIALIWMFICNWKVLRIVDAGFGRKLMLPILWLGAVVATVLALAVAVYFGIVVLSW